MSDDSQPFQESKKIGCRGCLLILLTGFFAFLAFAGVWILTAFNSAPETGQPLFTPNEAANYITSPLDANGDVDYLEFLNQEASEGVTPENNAMVKIVEAIGPKEDALAEFFLRLGTAIPPANGTYLVEFEDWYTASTMFDEVADLDFQDEYGSTRRDLILEYTIDHPWKPEQFPAMAAYLNNSQPAFKRVIAASKLKSYYAPMVVESQNDPIFSARLPYLQNIRDLARLLQKRSNMHLGQGKIQRAVDDAIVIARLGEIIAGGNTLMDSLVGTAIRGIGHQQLATISRHPSTQMTDLTVLQKLANQLLMVDRVPTIISERERLMSLDSVAKFIRSGQESTEDLLYPSDGAAAVSMLAKTSDAQAAMTVVNEMFDEIEAVFEQAKADPAFDFEQAFLQIENRLELETKNPLKNYFLLLLTKRARGKQLGKAIIGQLLPACDSIWSAERRCNSCLNLLRLTIEIEIFKRKNGGLPESLNQLVPDQLAEIPPDPYARKPQYGYRKNDADYRVYSFGINGADEDGRNPFFDDPVTDDQDGSYEGDDWFLSPLPKLTWQAFLDEQINKYEFGPNENLFDDNDESATEPNEDQAEALDGINELPDSSIQESAEENGNRNDAVNKESLLESLSG